MYETLKAEMKRQGISGYKLAKMAKIALPDYYAASNGRRPFFPSWRKRVADALGKSEAELFKDDE